MLKTFKEQLNCYISQINTALEQTMQISSCEPQKSVVDAMSYSLLSGGKRIRGVLSLAFCSMLGGHYEQALPYALAVEMVHAYSLIHDDLPCMDNDDLRRGKPSCHIQFGEDIALLAGDSLLTMAFEVISESAKENNLPAENTLAAVETLAAYAGYKGMIGGQVIDLESEGTMISSKLLKTMHGLKTAALIQAACELGAIAAGNNPGERKNAAAYGYNLGMAFQIQDDILDVTGDEKELGKPVGSDEQQQKANYITLFGLEQSKEHVLIYIRRAKEILKKYNENTFLNELTEMLLYRQK